MSAEIWRWVIVLALFAHGVGHVLFMPLLSGVMRLETDGHSWLLSGVLGDASTRLLVSLLAAVALAVFVAAAGGLLMHAAWWRVAAIGASVLSLALILAAWDGLPTSSAFFAVAFDVVVLAGLLLLRWPSSEMLGA
jgi:hypothetical protein